MKFRSVFDIIGPVMIGPSSSHTAGAARIGRVARSLFEENRNELSFHFMVLLKIRIKDTVQMSPLLAVFLTLIHLMNESKQRSILQKAKRSTLNLKKKRRCRRIRIQQK